MTEMFWMFILFIMAISPCQQLAMTGEGPEMPVAVPGEAKYYKLKTLPATKEGEEPGYVIIRRLSHGEKQHRRAFNSKMTVKASKGRKDVDSIIDTFNEKVDLYNFANCIVEHNCQDHDGRVFNFKDPIDVNKLDGRVAEEISTYIDKENNFEEDEELGNSSEASEPSS